MSEREGVHFRLMTYNIGGGRKDSGSDVSRVLAVMKEMQPDILGVQEAVKRLDFDNNSYEESEIIAEALGYNKNVCFGPTLSFKDNFHVGKPLFVQGVFDEWVDWWQGNGLFSRWPFVKLKDASQTGRPQNISLFRPLQYLGNRDTDPRFVILARLGSKPLYPYVLVTHFTTLMGERGREMQEIPGKAEEAQQRRWQQSQRLLDLIQKHLLDEGELIFLLGDFNAVESEPCISNVLINKGGFFLLSPEKKEPTHIKVESPIDHILIHPGNRRVEYKCWVVNDKFNASDHNPVVADITVYDEHSSRFQEFGPGVVRMEQ